MNSHELFDEFLKTFFIDKKCFISDQYDIILNESSLKENYTSLVENMDESDDDYDVKINKQFANALDSTKLVLLHAQWLWALGSTNIKKRTKRNQLKDLFPELDLVVPSNKISGGFASTGQHHSNKKDAQIRFNLVLFKNIYDFLNKEEVQDLGSVKDRIIKFCLFQKYRNEQLGLEFTENEQNEILTFDFKLSMPNILLHLSDKEKYTDVIVNSQQREIVQTFSCLVSKERLKDKNIDDQIYEIRKELEAILDNSEFKFYDDNIARIWKTGFKDSEYSLVQGLEYKKAIVLYGPPGTSKTYSANKLAESILNRARIQYLKDNNELEKIFNKESWENNIHPLQLHPSYTYEDFVIGYQIEENSTKPKKGKFCEICEKAEGDKYPHVLILDEINRVDLSKLFGEVFSRLENRKDKVELAIKGNFLKVPENLYVIGTMNEIDFSLEQIDFALRRRFLWFFKGFDQAILEDIIEEKNDEGSLESDSKQKELKRFVTNVTRLNKAIAESDDLGKKFEIGHTFFAEIIDIYKSYISLNSKSSSGLFVKGGPVRILWEISIEPMLKAYLGNLDEKDLKVKIEEFEKIYLKNG